MPPDSLATPVAPATSLLERTLGPDWRCLPDAMIRAGGESGPVDLVALHPRLGVVLVAFLDDGEEASPDEAVAALQAMLREFGCAARFPGTLNAAAIALEPARRARLAEAIRAAAGDGPETPPPEGWLDWLAQRLTTALSERPPSQAESAAEPALETEAELPRLVAPRERILLAQEPQAPAKRSWLQRWRSP